MVDTATVARKATDIRRFHVEFPDEAIDDLVRRIAATRSPERETVATWAEGAYPNLIDFNDVDEGNHFAGRQEPELFTAEFSGCLPIAALTALPATPSRDARETTRSPSCATTW